MAETEPILAVRDLKVALRTLDGVVEAVKGIDLDVDAGETVAIVGESGSGKSQTMMAVMGLLASNGERQRLGRLSRPGTARAAASASSTSIRGAKITMIFQEPMTSLDPLYTIGSQLIEPIRWHRGLSKARGADAQAIELLEARRASPSPERRIEGLSARIVRRPAPARDDRHGARQRPRHPDRRRADDRARRDDPGADPGAARRAAGAARHGDRLHHPRPRHRPALRRPGLRDAARARWWRAATTEAHLQRPAASLHQHAARRRARRDARRRCRRRAASCSRAATSRSIFRIGGGLPRRPAA